MDKLPALKSLRFDLPKFVWSLEKMERRIKTIFIGIRTRFETLKSPNFHFTNLYCSTNTLGKGMNPIILPPAMGK